MNKNAIGFSLLMAVVAAFFVYSYVESIEQESLKKFGSSVLVVKAKRDIKEQETINETMISLEVLPKKFLEPASVYFDVSKENEDTSKGMKSLVGTVAVVPIRKGEQVTHNKLTEPSIRTGLSPQITPGKRAIAIPVTETTGVAKLVKPGDRVDLIALIDMGGGKENKLSKTILQDVVVLSVGRNVTNNVARTVEVDSFSGKEHVKSLTEDSSFASVTLEVEPIQAQALALVLGNGENALTLSLRNNDDNERVQLDGVNMMEILGADVVKMQRRIAGGR